MPNLVIFIGLLSLLLSLQVAHADDSKYEVGPKQKNFLKCMVNILEGRRSDGEQIVASTKLALSYHDNFSDPAQVNELAGDCQRLKNASRKNKKSSKEEFAKRVQAVVHSYPLFPFYSALTSEKTQYLCNMTHVEVRAAAFIGPGLGVSAGVCRAANGKVKLAFGPAISLAVGIGAALVVHRELRILSSEYDHVSGQSIRDPSLYANTFLGGGFVYAPESGKKLDIRGAGIGLGHFFSGAFGVMFSGLTIKRDYSILHQELTRY